MLVKSFRDLVLTMIIFLNSSQLKIMFELLALHMFNGQYLVFPAFYFLKIVYT